MMKAATMVVFALLVAAVPLVVSAQRAGPATRPVAITAQQPTALPASVTLPCLIRLMKEVELAAEEAGVLRKLYVEEGDRVKAGQVLGQIDDTLARKQLEVAKYELTVAHKKATNKANLDYAHAAANVAEAAYNKALIANRERRKTFSEIEVKRLRLTRDQFLFQIKQEEVNLVIFGLDADVSQAKMEATKVQIERRQIKAPQDDTAEGSPPQTEWFVDELLRHEGEAVQQYEPVMRLIRVDRMWVEGFVKYQEFTRAEVAGRPVSVEVELARGRKVTLEGKIVSVGMKIRSTSDFKVRAEIDNQQENNSWLLQPDLRAMMTIHLR